MINFFEVFCSAEKVEQGYNNGKGVFFKPPSIVKLRVSSDLKILLETQLSNKPPKKMFLCGKYNFQIWVK